MEEIMKRSFILSCLLSFVLGTSMLGAMHGQPMDQSGDQKQHSGNKRTREERDGNDAKKSDGDATKSQSSNSGADNDSEQTRKRVRTASSQEDGKDAKAHDSNGDIEMSSSENELKQEQIDSVTTLCFTTKPPLRICPLIGNLLLYITEEDQADFDAKNFLKAHDICFSKRFNFQEFKESLLSNKNKDVKASGDFLITPAQLPQLLADAKSIIKSFLVTDDKELSQIKQSIVDFREYPPFKEGQLIQKPFALNRLFTYAKLQQVIKKKNLSHVRLPRKMLPIEDRNTYPYKCLSYEAASKLIDAGLKVYAKSNGCLDIKFEFDLFPHSYLELVAHREKDHQRPLSVEAVHDLEEIFNDIVFDFGDNLGKKNIFSDENGDAVIIDTEYFGTFGSATIADYLAEIRQR